MTTDVQLVCRGAERIRNDTNARLAVCYTHAKPSTEVLVIGPQLVIPYNTFVNFWRHGRRCSAFSRRDAARCKKARFGVMIAMILTISAPLGLGLLAIIFLMIAGLIVGCYCFILGCLGCLQLVLGRRRDVLQPKLEMVYRR